MQPRTYLLTLLCLLLAFQANTAKAGPSIRVTNYSEGTTLRYPVALVKGEIAQGDTIEAINTSSKEPMRKAKGLVYKGKFKILCELTPGANKLLLKTGKAKTTLTLNYLPQTNPYFVRVIYMTDKNGETAYQSPREDDPQNFKERLATAMKLMQTLTAERNFDLGFGRRTFNLEFDAAGEVKVHVFKGALAAKDYYAMPDQLWYRQVAKELEPTFPTNKVKNIVIAAYTRFDPKIGKMLGHTALGGGGQGLFGSGNLFTWPESIASTQAAFMDDTRLDPKKIMSDSAFRHAYWSAASTTIGATLHEMGHTFGLPHTNDPLDIMTRGFDHFNRVFTFVDAASARNAKPKPFAEGKTACFAPISAAALMTSPWFALDAPPANGRNDIRVTYDAKERKIVASGLQGIMFIGGLAKGDMVHFAAPPTDKATPLQFAVDVDPFRKAVGDAGHIVVLDSVGHRRKVELKALVK